MGILIALMILSPFMIISYIGMSPEERKAWRDGTLAEYQEAQKKAKQKLPILLLSLPKRFDPTSQEYMDRYSPKS